MSLYQASLHIKHFGKHSTGFLGGENGRRVSRRVQEEVERLSVHQALRLVKQQLEKLYILSKQHVQSNEPLIGLMEESLRSEIKPS